MLIELAGSERYREFVHALEPATYTSDESRQDAILQAAETGNLELIEALIKSGADIECKDAHGRTPLFFSVWHGHFTTSVFLLDHGADIHVQDKYGNSPLKMVDIWQAKRPNDMYRLVHEWTAKNKI